MKQLTVRGISEELGLAIRSLADSEGISLNQAAIRLLQRGAGIGTGHRGAVVGDTMAHLAGTWSEEEADEILEAVRDFDVIDQEFWG